MSIPILIPIPIPPSLHEQYGIANGKLQIAQLRLQIATGGGDGK
jgi:hypothetical protein